MQKRPGEPDLLLCASTANASTSVVKGQKRDRSLRGLKVFRGALAVPVILHDVEAELLTLHQRSHSSALDGRDVDENVRLAIALLDEAEAFGRIEELYGSRVHDDFLSNRIDFRRLAECQTPYSSKLRVKIVRAQRAETKFFSKIDCAVDRRVLCSKQGGARQLFSMARSRRFLEKFWPPCAADRRSRALPKQG
jgi:hypothetical protein